MSTGPTQETTARIGRYEIVRRLGQGGMAEVFLGRTVGPGGVAKLVCIKRLRPGAIADPRALERFSQEARTTFELQHANIVTVFDFGRDGQELFLAMEWIDGCDLATLLRALHGEGRTLAPLAAYVTAAMAKALAYAHDRTDHEGRPARLLHRDVTPGNILLSRRGEVLLTDFGIARALGQAGAPAGTPAYMAPEQARGEPTDARADLFALGLVLAEMLIGRRVRTEATFEAARAPVEIPDMSGAPPGLARLARALLAPEPAGRPGSAAEVERTLAPILAEEVLRGASPEAELAALVEKVAPPNRPGPEPGGPLTEAGVTASAPGEAAVPSPVPPGAGRRVMAAAVTAVALGLLAWRLGRRPAPAVAPHASPPPPPAAPAPAPAVSPPDASAALVVAEAPRRRPRPGTAWLRVTAPGSWVTVHVDGRKLGDGGGLFRIPAGRHELRVTNPALGFEQVMTIEAAPGQTLEYEFQPGH